MAELPFEEQYQAVLQNMEFALALAYRDDAKFSDHSALYVIETLVKHYNAETQGRAFNAPQFQPHEQAAYDSVKAMCEWRLGRQALASEDGLSEITGDDALQPAEIIACLKRIQKSIQFWQKRGGRRAYFEFVQRFLP